MSFATTASALKHTIHGNCHTFSIEEISTFMNAQSGISSRASDYMNGHILAVDGGWLAR